MAKQPGMYHFVNLTTHAITVDCAGDDPLTIEPSGIVCRVEQVYEADEPIGPIAVSIASFTKPDMLPDPQDDVFYIVSGVVERAVKGRPDVLSPGDFVRDGAGKILRCTGFQRTE
jgi:hypothetical protein